MCSCTAATPLSATNPLPSRSNPAVLGFVYAISGEVGNGQSVFSQIVSGGGSQAFTIILAVVLASFAPAVRGVSWEQVRLLKAPALRWKQ